MTPYGQGCGTAHFTQAHKLQSDCAKTTDCRRGHCLGPLATDFGYGLVSPVETVPTAVPTPRIEALVTVTSVPGSGCRKPLKESSVSEP